MVAGIVAAVMASLLTLVFAGYSDRLQAENRISVLEAYQRRDTEALLEIKAALARLEDKLERLRSEQRVRQSGN